MQPINATVLSSSDGFRLKVDNQDYFQTALSKIGEGGRCSVQLDKPVIPGTGEQNRFMHSLMSAFFETGMHSLPEHFPQSMEGLKHYYKGLFAMRNGRKTIKSWAVFTKHERMEFINMVISDIHQSGAYTESAKIQEIIQGAEVAGYWGLR